MRKSINVLIATSLFLSGLGVARADSTRARLVTIHCPLLGSFSVDEASLRSHRGIYLSTGHTVWASGIGPGGYWVESQVGDARGFTSATASSYEKCRGDLQPWLRTPNSEAE